MHNLVLLLLCASSVVIWPINRLVMKSESRMERYGMVISAATFLGSIIAALITRQRLISYPASLFGVAMGVAYSVGFCLIIFYCLKIGPSGPTTAINNLGVVFPVLLSIAISIRTQPIRFSSAAGIVLTFAALALMAFAGGAKAGGVTARWKAFVLVGWLFSGLSLSMQFLATWYDPGSSMAFTLAGYLTSFVVLFSVSIWRRDLHVSRLEFLCGGIYGVVQVLSAYMLFYVCRYIAGYIVFPLTLILPIAVMMLLGKFIYGEKVTHIGWLTVFISIAGIILLYI